MPSNDTFLEANKVIILPDNSCILQNKVIKNVINTAINNFLRSSDVALNIIDDRYTTITTNMILKINPTKVVSPIIKVSSDVIDLYDDNKKAITGTASKDNIGTNVFCGKPNTLF